MSEAAAPAAEGPAPLPTPPLNLPVGSVRALLTLAVLGTVWAQILRGVPVGEELRDTMLLILGYYFGTRAGKKPPTAEQFTTPASREDNPKDPLYLPRGAIRLLIVVGFGAVAYKLHEAGKLLTSTPTILILVGTFLLGASVKALLVWIGRRITGKVQTGGGHAVAAGTLAVVLAFCTFELLGAHDQAPTWFTPTFLGVIGFYLGKR